MATPEYLRALIDLATADDVDALLETAVALLIRQLEMHARIELWDLDGTRYTRGELTQVAHTTWIGIRYTVGAIHLDRSRVASEDIALLAAQLAPLAERLLERAGWQRRTIREDIALVYERRIRDALIQHDWNVSATARALSVSRNRVTEVARRWTRIDPMFRSGAGDVIVNTDDDSRRQTAIHSCAANCCTSKTERSTSAISYCECTRDSRNGNRAQLICASVEVTRREE
jgi:hypothetical protein